MTVVYRVMELMHKQRRQLEYVWLTPPRVAYPSKLDAQSLLRAQAELRDWNLGMKEDKTAFASDAWMSYTVDRSQYPVEFAKLGTKVMFMKNGTSIAAPGSATEMTFVIEPPAQVNFWHARVMDVKVVVYPLQSRHYKDIMVKLTKGPESHFFTSDGSRDSIKTYSHMERVFYRSYRINSCETVAEEEDTSDYIAYSPYGTWKVDILPAFFGDAVALQQADRIEFRFKLRSIPVLNPSQGLPMFESDKYASGITGISALSFEEADCAVSSGMVCLPNPCKNGGFCIETGAGSSGSAALSEANIHPVDRYTFACECIGKWRGKTCTEQVYEIEYDVTKPLIVPAVRPGNDSSVSGDEIVLDDDVLMCQIVDLEDDIISVEGGQSSDGSTASTTAPDGEPATTTVAGIVAAAGGSDDSKTDPMVIYLLYALVALVLIILIVVLAIVCRGGNGSKQAGSASAMEFDATARSLENVQYENSTSSRKSTSGKKTAGARPEVDGEYLKVVPGQENDDEEPMGFGTAS